jgi:hypothetical protein
MCSVPHGARPREVNDTLPYRRWGALSGDKREKCHVMHRGCAPNGNAWCEETTHADPLAIYCRSCN